MLVLKEEGGSLMLQEKKMGFVVFSQNYLFPRVVALKPGTRAGQARVNGKEIQVVLIRQGKISGDLNGKGVEITGLNDNLPPVTLMPGSYLAVFDLAGNLLAMDDYCCSRCFASSGRNAGHRQQLVCYQCGHSWDLPRPI